MAAGQVWIQDKRPPPNHPFLSELLTSGVSVGTANICTLPMDVVKVRLQLQTIQTTSGAAPQGLILTGVNVVRHEGVLALYKGLGPAVLRGLFYGGVRLGCYAPVKRMLGADKANPSLALKIVAGSLSGAVAAGVSNPTDLIKTRLQAKGSTHRNAWAVVRQVVATDGVLGLWRGTLPSMMRAAVLTAAQCATYDEAKTAWMRATGWGDDFATHLAASMVTGVVTTTATAPVDVVKTNMFMGGAQYSGPLHCAREIVRREGPRGLLRGWTANYVRLGPQTTVIFVVMEKLRSFSGLESL
ncbi:hypothetical protein WJX72_006922 [[Myrmecia] bisecta]|uniref:Uncharacterized protein n=1 Tax=[Myrmecia] bisecta TaxID=41462 RepID=A0AAW1R700_9CHLO